MLDAYLLHGFQRQLLNMKAVNNALCPRESIAAYTVHAVGQIKSYLNHLVAQTTVNLS